MPGFLYYLPGLSYAAASKDECRSRLAHVMDGRVIKGECHGGPDGDRGVLVVDPARVPADRLGFYPSRQEWRPAPARAYWVGWYTEEPPGPADLARSPLLHGHLVELCDGRDWMAPVARKMQEREGEIHCHRALPGAATLDEDGHWTGGQVQAKYRRLWEVASAFAEHFFRGVSERGISFEYGDTQENAVACLAANYAIGPVEVAALGLFDDQLYRAVEILKASIDWPTYSSWLKKKAAELTALQDGSPSEPGPPASTPATAPPTPT